MSVFSETTVQVNRPDDNSAPPQSKDVVAGPEKPPNNEPAAELSDVEYVSTYMAVSSPIEQKYYADSTTMPPLLGDVSTEDVPCSIKSEFEDKFSIKEEVVDLGNETYFYVDKKFQFKKLPKKVGFDRGLEPDHIVGATEETGKIMFLIAWKNSVDGEADLLEAKEIYEKCPQLAINYYEKRLTYVPNAKSNKKNQNRHCRRLRELNDDKKFQSKILPKKVGFDRGLEPDHIVGATKKQGKLMFLIAWKNSIDGEADLLEAKEIYEKYPQLAIKYFVERIEFVPPAKSNKKKD